MAPTTFDSIISKIHRGWDPIFAECERYCKAKGITDASESRIAAAIRDSRASIFAEHDKFVESLGKPFAHGDETFDQNLQSIVEKDLSKLLTLIRSPPVPPASRNAAKPDPKMDEWEEKAQDLARSASNQTVRALSDLASRLGYVPPSTENTTKATEDPFNQEELTYCKGASRLQNAKTDLNGIMLYEATEEGFTCKHCYLEISNFQSKAVESSSADWLLVASCHVLACPSLEDRRAVYRCVGCFSHGHTVVHMSFMGTLEHIRTCEYMKNWKPGAVRVPQSSMLSFNSGYMQQGRSDSLGIHGSDEAGQTVNRNSGGSEPNTPALPQRPAPSAPPSGSTNGYVHPSASPNSRRDAGSSRQLHIDPVHPDRQYSSGGLPSPPRSNNQPRSNGQGMPNGEAHPSVTQLIQIGMSRNQAEELLRRTGGNVDEAANLFWDGQ